MNEPKPLSGQGDQVLPKELLWSKACVSCVCCRGCLLDLLLPAARGKGAYSVQQVIHVTADRFP